MLCLSSAITEYRSRTHVVPASGPRDSTFFPGVLETGGPVAFVIDGRGILSVLDTSTCSLSSTKHIQEGLRRGEWPLGEVALARLLSIHHHCDLAESAEPPFRDL